MHRFSPFSNRGIRKTPKRRVKKETVHRGVDVVVDTLMTMGFSFEESFGITSYLDRSTMDVPSALRVMEKLEGRR